MQCAHSCGVASVQTEIELALYLPMLGVWVFVDAAESRNAAEMESLSQYIRGGQDNLK